jgi:mRNA interferase MazF
VWRLTRSGDIVTVALQGDLGKPRPALVMQSDLFAEHPSVTVLPITSTWVDAPWLRIGLEPGNPTGLRQRSQVMVDKPQSVARAKLGPAIGRVPDDVMRGVERALAVFLGLA